MDDLSGASFDNNGSSTVDLGSDLGPLGDAASPSSQASWNQAMADAGLDGGAGAGDMGWGNTGSASAPVSQAATASDEPAAPSNPNERVDGLWADRASVTAQMDQLNASSDDSPEAAERYQQLENKRDIIDANIRSTIHSSLSGTGLNEPGDLEAYMREQVGQAPGAQPGAYDRMSAADLHRFIKTQAPDYEASRSAEAAQRYGAAMGGPFGQAFGELGMGLASGVGETLGGALGTRAFRGGAGGVDTGPAGAGPRYQPGVATQDTPLPPVTGPWLRGTEGNAGLIPGQVAEKLQGRSFSDFGEFRSAFWKATADVPELAAQFSNQNLARIQQGYAPIASGSQQYGDQRSYVLHHQTPIFRGGGVFDMNNIAVVTPRFHQEILDPKLHFGGRSQ